MSVYPSRMRTWDRKNGVSSKGKQRKLNPVKNLLIEIGVEIFRGPHSVKKNEKLRDSFNEPKTSLGKNRKKKHVNDPNPKKMVINAYSVIKRIDAPRDHTFRFHHGKNPNATLRGITVRS